MDTRVRSEAALNGADIDAWVSRCTRRLMDLNPDNVDIAGDLLESFHRLPPEWAAATYVWLHDDRRASA